MMAGMRRRQSRSGCTGSAKAAGSAMSLAVALVVLLLGCAIPPASAELKASLAIQSPFDKHDHKGSRIIPYWEKSGSTNIMQTFIRMTADKPDNTGTLWSRTAIDTVEFSLEWKFRISGGEGTGYGDTIVLLISPQKYKSSEPGRFFGLQEKFTGVAIIVNTNRSLLSRARPGEPTGRHRDVSIVANNGTREYGDLISGMEGCTANVRFDERRDDFNVMQATRIRMKLSGNTVALEVDARNSGRWRRCATMVHMDMPAEWAVKSNVGIIAQTSENTNNHDLLSLRVYNQALEAWEVDTFEDGDELDTLVHHMEHELFNVHDSLQETINTLAEAEQEAERRFEDLEDSLQETINTLAEAEQEAERRLEDLEELRETNELLRLKIAKLEQLLRLKDATKTDFFAEKSKLRYE